MLCLLPKAISYGNCRKKIQYNISLFFKGVFVIKYKIEHFFYLYSSAHVKGKGKSRCLRLEKKLYPYSSGLVKGRGKRGYLLLSCYFDF